MDLDLKVGKDQVRWPSSPLDSSLEGSSSVPLQNLIEWTHFSLTSSEVEEIYQQHINESILKLYRVTVGTQIEAAAFDLWVKDRSGKNYLDFVGGFGVFSFGHCHPEIVRDVEKQLSLMPLSSRFMLSEPLARLSRVLAHLCPGSLSHTFMCNSGTEAVEGALKLARAATLRSEIVAMKNGYHGKTFGSLSVSGGDSSKKQRYHQYCGPFLPDCQHVEFGDIKALLDVISEKTAAVIVEPIQGEGGIVEPPLGYLPEVRRICDFYGIRLIVDEVQTGLGRTGKNFACQWEDVQPDLLCLGKALGGGVIPVGAIVGTKEVFLPLLQDPLFHTSTFGGNPLACVAALCAIRILLRDQLAQNSFEQGKILKKALEDLRQLYPEIIREVRGKGLMIGLETHRPSQVGALINLLRRQGILVCHTLQDSSVLRLEPPLTISLKEIAYFVEQLGEVLAEVRVLFEKEQDDPNSK